MLPLHDFRDALVCIAMPIFSIMYITAIVEINVCISHVSCEVWTCPIGLGLRSSADRHTI
jgi:hypothetical protein